MTNRMKRFLCMLLAVLMVLSTPVSVFAENSTNTTKQTKEVSITEALADAKAGETITLSADTEASVVVVPENVTLDLNGYKLKADYMACYGVLVDQSESNNGLLAVSANRFYIREDNTQLPVKSNEGYKFFEVTKFNKKFKDAESKYIFQPFVEEGAHEFLKKGAEASGVTINVRLSWNAGNSGKRSQDFVYSDEFVKNFFNSYVSSTGKYSRQLALTLKGAENFKDLSFTAVVAGANVVKCAEPIVINKTEEDVPADNNQLTEEMTINNGKASAVVSMGTELEADAKELTLTTEEMDATTSNIQLGDGEQMLSMDVHVNGVSKDNTVPVIITIDEIAPEFLNQGNIKLYHVENGETVEMTRVYSLEEVDAHNEYYYDILTGTITMALASFSEVAVVADTDNAWEGNYDYSWYTNAVAPVDGEGTTEYTIANADQLAAFGAIVGGMNGQTRDDFAGQTVKLLADIDLGDKDNAKESLIFHPIGYYYTNDENKDGTTGDYYSTVYSFRGTFDGNGHTISNFYQNTWEIKGDYDGNYYKDAMGLFGYVNGTPSTEDGNPEEYVATIKNLTVNNFSSDGEFTPTGVIAAYATNATFENIAITNCNPRVYNTGNGGIVGIGGNDNDPDTYKLTFNNITIDNSNIISALWGSWDVACGGLVGMFRGAGHAYMTNCHVAAQIDVYNDVCGNYQYYWYRYSGMMIGTNKNMVTDKDGYTVPETSKFHAKDCTVHFGDWNDYYYCELVANSLASYTHDHQFSRLTEVKKVDGKDIIYLDGTEGTVPDSGRCNYVVVNGEEGTNNATCYHFLDGAVWNHEDAGKEVVNSQEVLKENNQHIYLPFNQLFTGYGWGVKHVPIYDDGTPNPFNGVTILPRETANSVVKFEGIDDKNSYTTESTVKIGDLFKATEAGLAEQTKIDTKNVQVSVSPVSEDSTVGGTYVANTSDWTEGTLKFSGVGAATVTITDYYFCTPTTITVEILSADKFVVKEGEINVYAGESIVLGDLFAVVDGKTVDSEKVDVKVSVTDFDYIKNTSDWTQSTLVFKDDGSVTITIKEDENYNEASKSITVSLIESAFEHAFPNTDDYLYRVGNKNAVAINKLFKISENVESKDIGKITVQVEDFFGNKIEKLGVSNVNWAEIINLDFEEDITGPVKITISSEYVKEEKELWLEVIPAVNISNETINKLGEGSYVLLNDVSLVKGGALSLSNGTLYGNGFVLDVALGRNTSVTGDLSDNYLVGLDNATLDNVQIIGEVYTTYGGYASSAYNNPVVRSRGNNVIANCYIANCSAPVRILDGNLEIVTSTLEGGNFANLDIRGGTVTLEDVVTINQTSADGKSVSNEQGVVGLGIVFYEAPPSAKLVVKKDDTGKPLLTQYNCVSEKVSLSGQAQMLKSEIFGDGYDELRYADSNGVEWINTGIVSMDGDVNGANITRLDGYLEKNISFSSYDGYAYCPDINNNDITADIEIYSPKSQYVLSPQYKFDHSMNNKNQVEGSNYFCYENNGDVYISMDEGDKFEWKTSILEVQKNGKKLDYKVSMDKIDYTDSTILFDKAGNYLVEFSYDDKWNYKLDENGNVIEYVMTYVKTVEVNVSTVKAAWKNAEITVNSNASDVNEYVMSGDYDYSYRINFLVPLSIVDYSEKGVAEEVDLTSGIKSAKFVNDNGTNPGQIDKGKGTITVEYNDGRVLKVKIAAWTGSGPSTKTCTVKYEKEVYLITDGASNAANTDVKWNIEGYEYTGKNGATVSDDTKINLSWTTSTKGYNSKSECVTPDALITLADGSWVRVDSLSGNEELLVWNLETGKFDFAPIMFVDSEAEAEFEIIHLYFSDGTDVKVIYEHGFWDYDLNKYVYLDRNASDYIGHEFAKQDGDKLSRVTLTDVVLETEITTAWSPVTEGHLCYFVNGMLSMPGGVGGLFNIFDVDAETMTYDFEAMAQDIETYGLFTYEELNSIEPLSEDMFNVAGGAYLKVSIGKGNMTMDDLVYMIQRYSKYFD